MRQVPVFDRIRLILKFIHRSLRIFSNFEKIFIELGDTAPQSWTHFGNFRKIQDPSTTFGWESSKKCSRVSFSWFSKINQFFSLEISELKGPIHFIFGIYHLIYMLDCQKMYFSKILFQNIFSSSFDLKILQRILI